MQKHSPARVYWFVGIGILALMAAALHLMGRVPWCTCNYIKLWHGVTVSSENSQHLFDWYSFTHIVHGLAFYALLWLIDRKKRLSFGAKLLIALGVEAAWEVLENTDMVINRYRAATISLDYYGDSIINSLGDVFAMLAGFYYAFRARPWMSIVLCVVLEVGLALIIHDNLLINLIMLIYPIPAIRAWQSGAALPW